MICWFNAGQKFPSKSLEVSLQCDVFFSSEPAPPDATFEEDPFCVANNAYILVCVCEREREEVLSVSMQMRW